MTRLTATLLVLCVAFSLPASAQEAEPYTYQWYRNDLFWRNYYCGGRYRPEGCARYRRSRYYRPPNAPTNCKPRVRVVGWEANTQRGAHTYGERAWFFAVRHDLGAKYANLDRAKDVRFICDPSTVTQALKRLLWICVVDAIPCQASKADNAPKRSFSDHDAGAGD